MHLVANMSTVTVTQKMEESKRYSASIWTYGMKTAVRLNGEISLVDWRGLASSLRSHSTTPSQARSCETLRAPKCLGVPWSIAECSGMYYNY